MTWGKLLNLSGIQFRVSGLAAGSLKSCFVAFANFHGISAFNFNGQCQASNSTVRLRVGKRIAQSTDCDRNGPSNPLSRVSWAPNTWGL